jgi:outer membrane protein OmpA-like peptidoglycan-associated protein
MARVDHVTLAAKWTVFAVLCAAVVTLPAPAAAQQPTFHLDRLEVPGAPNDGVVLFRPVTKEHAIVYAQLALGLAINPLRTDNITNYQPALSATATNIIKEQFSTYMSAGFELFDRLTLGATFPIAWAESGNIPTFPAQVFSGASYTNFSVGGPAVGDLRLDARYVAWRNAERSQAVGVQLSGFAPTGTTTNFGGDGAAAALVMVSGEWTPKNLPTFVLNTGVDFRPDNSINDPNGNGGPRDGLGIGWEWRWAAGALMPLAQGKFRIGLTVFGQTGLTSDKTTGPTFFTKQNTPIEWNFEGRMKLPAVSFLEHWFAGASAGTLILPGYGAPDLRIVALVGSYWQIEDTHPHSPEAMHDKVRESIHESLKDTDGDGIPDDIDACPTEPEDHKDPDPLDGCPAPADRDGDGIPDKFDKCPDQPEDKDGIEDQDGCPEDDADQDGIPDAKDACPKEPGQPDPDPKKNGCPRFIKLEGSSVRVLQQVHFQTGSATILPDSFPMLQEIANLLKVTPAIKKMRIEGHTDNRGAAEMNLDLSKRRAASVMTWLVQHGIEQARLESEGYGLTRPIETNDTEEGRLANRRVEFKILDEGDAPETPAPPAKKPAAETPKEPLPIDAD